MPARRLSSKAARRRLAGSRRGAEAIKASFSNVITRTRYCELVGIHRTTLRRWEREGVMRPALLPVRNIPTHVFTEDDVDLGRRLVALLKDGSGRLSLAEAKRQARRKRAR
jgi:hypothetical protein